MKSKVRREYKGSDVGMLTTLGVVLENAIVHQEELQVMRMVWSDDYFKELKAKGDHIMATYFGVDAAKNLRNATQVLKEIQEPVLTELALFKIQVEVDFQSDKQYLKDLLSQLGFDSSYREVQRKNQEALIELLYTFKQNISPELKATIVGKGVNASLIERIVEKAEMLRSANVTQESLKSNRKVVTQTSILEFNDYYQSVIGICKIASRFLIGNEALKDCFNYSKILAGLTSSTSTFTRKKRIRKATSIETT